MIENVRIRNTNENRQQDDASARMRTGTRNTMRNPRDTKINVEASAPEAALPSEPTAPVLQSMPINATATQQAPDLDSQSIARESGLVGKQAQSTEPRNDLKKLPGTTVYQDQLSNLPEGLPLLSQARQFRDTLGNDVLYIKGFGAGTQENGSADQKGREAAGQKNGANDTVRLSVEDGGLRVLYPQGGNTSSHSGLQFLDHIPGTPDREGQGEPIYEVYINYKVKFEKDFPWQSGGKLPGVIASDQYGSKEDLSSLRLMWREAGNLEFYIHTPHEERTRLLWDNGDAGLGHAAAKDDEWVDITMRVKMNTVANGTARADGELEGWINGEHAAFYDDVKIRGDEDTNINSLFFSTFYGGSSGSGDPQWWPPQDSTADFKDIQISKV